MATGTFVTYCRVSTQRQGKSGLGLEAQEQAIAEFLNGGDWRVVGRFVEVESGKCDDNRPQLQAAIQAAKATGSRLLISKLDRLSRNAAFLLQLRDSGVDFVCADMPNANAMTVGIMALVAQDERERISARTKAALQAAKARGQRLGSPRGSEHLLACGRYADGLQASREARSEAATAKAEMVRPYLERVLQEVPAASLRQIAARLDALYVQTPRGGSWSAAQVQRVRERLGL